MEIFRDLEVLVLRDIVKTSLNFKLHFLFTYFRLPVPRGQQARALVIVSDWQRNSVLREVGLLLLMGQGRIYLAPC